MLFVSGVLIAIVFTLLSWWYYKYHKYEKYLNKFPVPPFLPLFGHLLDFRDSAAILKSLLKYQKICGDNFRVVTGFRTFLVVSGLDLLKLILSSTQTTKKSEDYAAFVSWLGDGLITSSGEKWKKHRKFTTPAFHFEILEQFVDVFDSAGNILLDKLEQEIGTKSFDIYPYISLCALDIICETTMGTSVNAQVNSESDYIHSVNDMCKIILARTFSPLKMVDFFYHLSNDYRKEKKAIKIIHNFSNSVIKQRRETLKNLKNSEEEINDSGKKKRLALLDLLLKTTIDGNSLSDEDIRTEVDTFMFAGHDTVTSAITFALFCLANNSSVQEKVITELKSIFHDDFTRPATFNDLRNMKYLEMVIKETLRLYPSGPLIGRILEEDLEYDGTILCKGLVLSLFIYGVGRNPKIFPDPEIFDPERFNAENTKGRVPYSYIPFSAGPRNCIGQKFAMLEMKAVIAKILRRYKLNSAIPEHKLALTVETVLKSSNGVHLSLTQRSKHNME